MMEIHYCYDDVAKKKGEGRKIPGFTVMHWDKLKRPGYNEIAEALIITLEF